MSELLKPLERLVEQFQRLPGIGRKTATRLAYSIIDMDSHDVEEFSDALLDVCRNIVQCPRCFNLSSGGLCDICNDVSRDQSVICVVEDYRTVMAFERVREYRGLYHVLHGAISPTADVGPDELRIYELLQRLKTEPVEEIIIATNPTIEGETTAMYLTRLIKPLGIKVTRPATGIPVGGDLEYADEATLFRAIENRHTID